MKSINIKFFQWTLVCLFIIIQTWIIVNLFQLNQLIRQKSFLTYDNSISLNRQARANSISSHKIHRRSVAKEDAQSESKVLNCFLFLCLILN